MPRVLTVLQPRKHPTVTPHARAAGGDRLPRTLLTTCLLPNRPGAPGTAGGGLESRPLRRQTGPGRLLERRANYT